MREPLAPRLHLFVCANRRPADSPLGAGCGERGDAIYDALKATNREVVRVWITKTHCLGICPRKGCTVARYPNVSPPIVTEVDIEDVPGLLASKQLDPLDELAAMEELQRKKVLDLARRLKPGLTLEDVQNPHDFPELDDPDWHYADGVLSGIASVKTALTALKKRDS